MSMFDDVLGMGRTSIFEGAYEPEVEEITMESVNDLPSYMDPIEFMTQVACEQELNMQKLDMAIMAEEYVYLRENGTEMVYEATSVQSIIDKCRKSVDWLWDKITKFFKEVQKKFDQALKLDERFLSTYRSKALKYTEKVTIKTYLQNLDVVGSGKAALAMYNNIADAISQEDVVKACEDKDADMGEIMTKVRSHIFSDTQRRDNGDDAKAILKAILNTSKGVDADEKRDIRMTSQEAITRFKNSKIIKNDLKQSYDRNKKVINTMYKSLKRLEGILKRGHMIPTDQSKAVHIQAKIVNRTGKILTLANKTYVKIINAQRAGLKQIIVKAAALGSGSNDNEKAKEKRDGASYKTSGTTGAFEGALIDSVEFADI